VPSCGGEATKRKGETNGKKYPPNFLEPKGGVRQNSWTQNTPKDRVTYGGQKTFRHYEAKEKKEKKHRQVGIGKKPYDQYVYTEKGKLL